MSRVVVKGYVRIALSSFPFRYRSFRNAYIICKFILCNSFSLRFKISVFAMFNSFMSTLLMYNYILKHVKLTSDLKLTFDEKSTTEKQINNHIKYIFKYILNFFVKYVKFVNKIHIIYKTNS